MAVPQSVRKSATSGKPEDRRAFPPDPWDQGRSVRTGIAEDALLSQFMTRFAHQVAFSHVVTAPVHSCHWILILCAVAEPAHDEVVQEM